MFIDIDDTCIITVCLYDSNAFKIYCYQFISGIEINLCH